MAGDWIPVRCDLEGDPAVFHLAKRLDCSRREAVGHLVAFWSWADSMSRSGHAAVTPTDIDALLCTPGFADALASTPETPWLIVDETGHCEIPRFERWMGRSSKNRLNAVLRKRRQRDREALGLVTPESQSRVTTENSTEDSKDNAARGAAPEAGAENGKPPKKPPSQAAREIAAYLGDCIHHWKPDARITCEGTRSVTAIDRMLRIDKRDPTRIRGLLTWLFRGGKNDYQPRGDFDWRPNILSGDSLRRQYDKLDVAFTASTNPREMDR
jgi:hypothetical protein